MNKFKPFLAIAIALLSNSAAMAEAITPAQAINRLTASDSKAVKSLSSAQKSSLKLALTKDFAGTNDAAIYLFSTNDNNYIVAPADDCAPAVLGYGDNFNVDNMPADMQWWLESYARQIKAMVQSNATYTPLASHAVIAPLVKTTWNQSAPYNNQCPLVGSSRSVTGCVATSTAQIANYHQLPDGKGTGSNSYTWNGTTLSFNYSTTQFRWSSMLDSYSGIYTTTQANAVASLMYACGVGVNMNYSPSASGASSMRIPALFYKYLGYDNGVAYMMRDYFTADQWDNIIYNELAAARPVVYDGQSNDGGHSFICDGYDGSLYHINWGWGGVCDGYFLLSLLDPTNQGIGGSADGSGFDSDQDAIIGIQAPIEGSEVFLPLYASGGFQYDNNYGFWFGMQDETYANAFFNYSYDTFDICPGLRLENAQGNNTFAWAASLQIKSLGGQVFINATVPSDLPAGTYKAYPVAKHADGTAWFPIYIPAADTQYVTVRKGNNGIVTYNGSDPDEVTLNASVTSIKQNDNWINGTTAIASTTISNLTQSSVSIPLKLVFTSQAGETQTIGIWSLTLAAGKTTTYNLSFTCKLPDGKYTVKAYDTSIPAYISDEFTVYVGVRPTAVTTDVTSLVLKEDETANVTATVAPSNAFDTSVTWSSDNTSVATIDDKGNIKAIAAGTATISATTINDLVAPISLTVVKDSSGVEGVEADNIDTTPRYYNLQGVEIANPQAGQLYIVRRGHTVSKEVAK